MHPFRRHWGAAEVGSLQTLGEKREQLDAADRRPPARLLVPLVYAHHHPGKQQPELFGGAEGMLEAPKVRVDVNLKLPDCKAHAFTICIVTSSPATSTPQPCPKPCGSSCLPASGPCFWREGHKWSGFWSQTLWVWILAQLFASSMMLGKVFSLPISVSLSAKARK